jgi:thiamine biosynthesis lipoprotein
MPHAPGADYRDIALDSGAGTVTLRRPLSLDLGAVAKGFAIDLAATELRPLRDFAVNAGGDVYVGGLNAEQQPWRIGIRDPRDPRSVVKVLRVSDAAVCTSGDYERRSDRTGGHHIVDPGTGVSAGEVASVTVVAPTAALADALATAAFVLGPSRGRRFLERSGVEGLILTSEGKSIATAGIEGMSE